MESDTSSSESTTHSSSNSSNFSTLNTPKFSVITADSSNVWSQNVISNKPHSSSSSSSLNVDLPEAEFTSSEGKIEQPSWAGFKIVLDNVDKNVKRRFMHIDRQNISLHCVNMYAVKYRVDLSSFSDKPPTFPSHSTLIEKMLSVLPTPADDHQLKHNFIIHISRILATHMPFFKACSDEIITWHIKHDYYEAMSSQSEVVSIIHSYII